MDYSYKLAQLVKTAKKEAKDKGERLTNGDIAEKMGINRTYFSELLNGSEQANEKHIAIFQVKLAKYLPQAAAVPDMNAALLLLLSVAEDYAEWKSEVTKTPFDEVMALITKRGPGILSRSNSWLPREGEKG